MDVHTMQYRNRPDKDAVVIVGGGQAAAACARVLRAGGHAGPLHIIGREIYAPYERPPLSKAVLAGEEGIEASTCLSPEEAASLDIDLRLGATVASLDRTGKQVVLSGGDRIDYDWLVLATGGRARFLPGYPPADNVFYLRDADDALRLGQRLVAAPDVLIVGGGWLGLEIAATARALGCEVHLVEAADRLCARAAPSVLSDMIADLHLRHGTHIHLGADARIAARNGGGYEAQGMDGAKIGGDVLVVSIGLLPETSLAETAGLQVRDGILVDDDARTSDPAIFAIGDCAAQLDAGGRVSRQESWQNANESAQLAAVAILGAQRPARALPYFWSDQFGVRFQIVGDWADADQVICRGAVRERQSFLFVRDGRLCGMAAMDSPQDIGFGRKLIESKTQIDPALAVDPDIPLNKARFST